MVDVALPGLAVLARAAMVASAPEWLSPSAYGPIFRLSSPRSAHEIAQCGLTLTGEQNLALSRAIS